MFSFPPQKLHALARARKHRLAISLAPEENSLIHLMNTAEPHFSAIKTGLFTILSLIVLFLAGSLPAAAQAVPEPRREQLLNGMRILIWQRAGDQNVLLKLRIHSGAAFDPAGRAGTMALLGDALFSDPTTREYVTEEMGGRLEVMTDYDSITITLLGRAAEFERIVELLRTALVSPQLTAENIAKLRDARIKMINELGISPGTKADRAIAARLYGDFPYGRPHAGTSETLMRVERADLLLARERFLNANNGTLVIAGGVEPSRVMRALRQLLGQWRKSETIVPSTFRLAEAPDTRTLIIDLPGAETTEIRLAARGLSRSDRDRAAADVLALLVRDRWQAALPALNRSALFARHESHVLPGIFIAGASVPNAEAASALAAARNVLRTLATTPVPTVEFERARSEAAALFNKQLEQPETLAGLWLDAETYNLGPVSDQARLLRQLSAADVQRVAAKLFREAPVASIAVGPATVLEQSFTRAGEKVLVPEAANAPAPSAKPANSP